MMMKSVLLTAAVISIGTLTYGQDTERVQSGNVTTQTTISNNGMYGGSSNKEAKGHFDAASAYGESGDLENAKKYYLKAIKKDKKFVEAYDNLGLVCRRLGDLDGAEKYYKESIKLYPEGVMAHQNLAAVYGMKQDYASAVGEFETIAKLEPNNPEGYFGLANSYMVLEKYDDALKNGMKALQMYEAAGSSHLADGNYLVGLINYYKGDKEAAKKYIEVAKSKGAKIHPQLAQELFGESAVEEEDPMKLETKEDYAKHEQTVMNGYQWLMNTPVGKETETRQGISAFLMQWMTGSPNVSIALSEKVVTYMDCGDCLMIFMTGWSNYCLETRDFDHAEKGALAGTESVIKFYEANKKALGKNKELEKLIKLQKDGKLASFIKKNS